MRVKIFIGGVIVGGIIFGGVFWLLNIKDTTEKDFANKQRCVIYTEKRQAEAEESNAFLQSRTYVQGFYSPTANTCMTNNQEIFSGHYITRTLIDELTGEIEATFTAFEGKNFEDLSLEAKREQLAQDKWFGEQLNYFRGEK